MSKSKININEHIKNRKFRKKEEDGSITTMLCLECNGINKLHSIEEPALINEKQRRKHTQFISNATKEPPVKTSI